MGVDKPVDFVVWHWIDLLTFGRDESHFESAANRVFDVGNHLDMLEPPHADVAGDGEVNREGVAAADEVTWPEWG